MHQILPVWESPPFKSWKPGTSHFASLFKFSHGICVTTSIAVHYDRIVPAVISDLRRQETGEIRGKEGNLKQHVERGLGILSAIPVRKSEKLDSHHV